MIHGTDTLHGWQICDSLRSYSTDTADDDTSTVTVFYVVHTSGTSTDDDIARCRTKFSIDDTASAIDALNELANVIQDEKSDDEPEELELDLPTGRLFIAEKQESPELPKIRPRARSPP